MAAAAAAAADDAAAAAAAPAARPYAAFGPHRGIADFLRGPSKGPQRFSGFRTLQSAQKVAQELVARSDELGVGTAVAGGCGASALVTVEKGGGHALAAAAAAARAAAARALVAAAGDHVRAAEAKLAAAAAQRAWAEGLCAAPPPAHG